MEIDQLKRFLFAADLGSLSKAAKALNVTQPALTQSIKALESSLGMAVFSRGSHGIKLTPFGATLLPRAQSIINESNRIRDDVHVIKNRRSARLVIGVAPYLNNHIFPQALDRVMAALPDLAISIEVGYSTDLAHLLQRNEIDLAFVGYNDIYADDPMLRFDATLRQSYVLVARPGHPLFKIKPYADRALATARWVLHDFPPTDLRIRSFFEALGVAPPVNPIRTNSQSMMKTLAVETDTIALLSHDSVWPEVTRGDLRVIKDSAFGFEAKAGLLYRREAAKTPAMRQAIAEITKACARFGR